MHLWDVIVKYSNNVPVVILAISKIPNGDPLPQDNGRGEWEREITAISENEADHQIEIISKRKC